MPLQHSARIQLDSGAAVGPIHVAVGMVVRSSDFDVDVDAVPTALHNLDHAHTLQSQGKGVKPTMGSELPRSWGTCLIERPERGVRTPLQRGVGIVRVVAASAIVFRLLPPLVCKKSSSTSS